MVFEAILNPLKAEKRWDEAFLLGVVYSTLAIFLSLWVFKDQASLVMVFFTTFASIPFIYALVGRQEKKDMLLNDESTILKAHSKALMSLLFLFIGFVSSFSFWYVLLPSSTTGSLFLVQTQTIVSINGNMSNISETFMRIFTNNLKVIVFCILFSFIYGLGAIFILTWNASVLGTAIGNFIKSQAGVYAAEYGYIGVSGYLNVVSMSLLRYFIHGIPEMLAYFTAGLAGSIISMSIIRKHYKSKKFEKVLLDVSELVIISVLMIFVSAILEVFVTPLFFS